MFRGSLSASRANLPHAFVLTGILGSLRKRLLYSGRLLGFSNDFRVERRLLSASLTRLFSGRNMPDQVWEATFQREVPSSLRHWLLRLHNSHDRSPGI
jgi:hypothetical protein